MGAAHLLSPYVHHRCESTNFSPPLLYPGRADREGTIMLTGTDADHFHREGYLLYHQPIFSPDDFGALKVRVEALLDLWQTYTKKHLEAFEFPHFMDPGMLAWIAHPSMLDNVEGLIGPDIALFASHLLTKPPSHGARVPWHQDSQYWEGRFQPMEVVTCWLAIDDSTPENGCMRVIPGSHRGETKKVGQYRDPADVFGSEILNVDETTAVDCALRANEASFHQAHLVHGSSSNLSTQRRCGFTVRYVSTHCAYAPRDPNEKLYLLRGSDPHDQCKGVFGRPNESWLSEHAEFQALAEAVLQL